MRIKKVIFSWSYNLHNAWVLFISRLWHIWVHELKRDLWLDIHLSFVYMCIPANVNTLNAVCILQWMVNWFQFTPTYIPISKVLGNNINKNINANRNFHVFYGEEAVWTCGGGACILSLGSSLCFSTVYSASWNCSFLFSGSRS